MTKSDPVLCSHKVVKVLSTVFLTTACLWFICFVGTEALLERLIRLSAVKPLFSS